MSVQQHIMCLSRVSCIYNNMPNVVCIREWNYQSDFSCVCVCSLYLFFFSSYFEFHAYVFICVQYKQCAKYYTYSIIVVGYDKNDTCAFWIQFQFSMHILLIYIYWNSVVCFEQARNPYAHAIWTIHRLCKKITIHFSIVLLCRFNLSWPAIVRFDSSHQINIIECWT